MKELEKILQEIDKAKNEYPYACFPWYLTGLSEAEKIIRKHLKDCWIPVEERMPTQEECKDNLFWITYDGSFGSSCKVAKCQWVFSYDENENDDSYSEFYIDQSPCIYTPSQNLVKAWKIIDIPEPYRPERSDNNEGE